MELLKNINDFIAEVLNNMGFFAPILASILIGLEALIPMLPLAVFITLNFEFLGVFWGLIVSWLFTCLGCYLVFKLSQSKFSNWFEKKMLKKHPIPFKKMLKRAENLKLEQLTILLAIPFFPSIIFNVASGITGVSNQKYLVALLIGKLFEVGFWGILGTSLLDSFKNPDHLIRIIILMLWLFLATKIINKKYKIN